MLRIENHCNISQTLAYIIVAAKVSMELGPGLRWVHTCINAVTLQVTDTIQSYELNSA